MNSLRRPHASALVLNRDTYQNAHIVATRICVDLYSTMKAHRAHTNDTLRRWDFAKIDTTDPQELKSHIPRLLAVEPSGMADHTMVRSGVDSPELAEVAKAFEQAVFITVQTDPRALLDFMRRYEELEKAIPLSWYFLQCANEYDPHAGVLPSEDRRPLRISRNRHGAVRTAHA